MLLFTDLPLEIVSHVLGYVEPDDLAAVERVCHRLHDFVSRNLPVYRDVYGNYFDAPPKGLSLDWEREIRDYLRLKSICLSKSPNKIAQLPFVYETTKRILSHSQPIHIDTDPDTLVRHRTFRNPRILSNLLSPYPQKDSFVCQSWLFERARYLGSSSDEEDEGPSSGGGLGHGHGRSSRSKSRNKANGKQQRPPFCLPGPPSVDPDAHMRRQRSAELQCLLGMPSLVCPSGASSERDERPEELGELEFVLETVDMDEDEDEDEGEDEDEEEDDDYVDYDYESVDNDDDYEDMDEDGHESAGGDDADQHHQTHENADENEDEVEDEDEDHEEEDDHHDHDHNHHHHHHHHYHHSRRWRPRQNSQLRNMYPLAAAKVYDMRENTLRTRWGPFQSDGSGRVDWERLEAILIVLRFNITVKGLLKFPALREYWDTPFAGSWPSSYLPMLRGRGAGSAEAAEAFGAAAGAGTAGEGTGEGVISEEDILALDQKDPYGVTGTWMRIVCFLDYADFFAFNFTRMYPSELPMDPLDQDEELRVITMRIHATSIEAPGPNDHPDYPVVHFKGLSYSMDDFWDDNANSAVQGIVRTTKEGHVHWTTFSLFEGEQRWRSEGIQIGGHKSGRGVVGTWFDSNYNGAGPCGPTAFWKMHERGAERSLSRGNAFSYLLANTVDNSIRIVVNINHPLGQLTEIMEDPGAFVHPMIFEDGSSSSGD